MSQLEPILSRTEVQAILDSAHGGGRRRLTVTPVAVDLASNDRNIRTLVPTLMVGFKRVAEGLRTVLTSVLRSKAELKAEAPEILSGRGFSTACEQAASLVALRIHAGGEPFGFAVLALDSVLTFSIIERLFGGGGGPPVVPGVRSTTLLERTMLLHALGPVLTELNTSLEPREHFQFELHSIETTLDLIPGYTPDVSVLHTPFTMTLGEQLASMSLALPCAALEGLRGRAQERMATPQDAEAMLANVSSTPMQVSVELGRAAISMRQLLQLEPGQVLELDTHRGAELPVRVQGITKFHGVAVQEDKAIAIELTRRQT